MFRFINFFCVSIRKQLFGVISPVFKIQNSYVPKSTMGALDPLKGPSSDLMTWSDNFKFNPNYFNKSLPRIILYLPLAESYTWHYRVTTFVALSSGKVEHTSTLKWLVILPDCVCQCIREYFLECSFSTRIPLKLWDNIHFPIGFNSS